MEIKVLPVVAMFLALVCCCSNVIVLEEMVSKSKDCTVLVTLSGHYYSLKLTFVYVFVTILLTKIIATQNVAALDYYHRVRGLYFLAVIFAATVTMFIFAATVTMFIVYV